MHVGPQIAQIEYARGMEHGKELGRLEAAEHAHTAGFLEGYKTARSTLDKLTAFRNGTLMPDSPDLAFLFDPSHPENPFNRGMQIGQGGHGGQHATVQAACGHHRVPISLVTPPDSQENASMGRTQPVSPVGDKTPETPNLIDFP